MGEALLGRLGKTVLQFELLLDDEDYELWKLREEMKKAEQIKDYMQMELLLEEYRTKMPSNSVHQQFYMYHCVKCKMCDTASRETVCQMLYEALLLTKPNLEETDVCIYNLTEIEIVLLLYRYHFSKWENNDVEKELSKILMYIQKVYSGRLKQETEIQVFLELVSYEEQMENYISAIKYIDEAIQVLSEGRSLEYIAELHFRKAQILEKQYRKNEGWETKKLICKRECLLAYHVFDTMEQDDKRNELETYCEEKLGWQITK